MATGWITALALGLSRRNRDSDDTLTRRGGLGVHTPIFGDFLPRATIFLVLTAFNSVLPELVVLISTTNSGGTALNAADRIFTRKVVARGSKIGVSTPSPPRLEVQRQSQRQSQG